jgi:tetratricopeptide (TPR) repeat protein
MARGVQVWWVRADEQGALAGALYAVAFQVGASDDELTHGHPADALWRWLNALDTPWLLVLDNADDVDLLASAPGRLAEGTGWLRPPAQDVGAVLVTTRDGRAEHWGEWSALHPVDMLDRRDAAQVLLDLAPDAGTVEQAELLAQRLRGLPLALTLAGSYLATVSSSAWPDPGMPDTFDRYRLTLDDDLADVYADAAPGTDEVPRRTPTLTWELSLDLLAKRGQAAARPLLRLLSCFGAAPIPYLSLLDVATMRRSSLFPDLDARTLSECIRALADVRLIDLQVTAPADGNGRRMIDLHPLVRSASRRYVDTDEHLADYLSLVTALLERATGSLAPDSRTDWPAWAVLAPHCPAPLPLLRHVQHPVRDQVATATAPAFMAAGYWWATGFYATAVAEFDAILKIRQRSFGGNDPETIAVRHALALALRDDGRYQEAESELRAIVAIRSREEDEDDLDLLALRHALALTLRDEGRYHEAEQELRALLDVSESVLGENHPRSLQTRHSYASVIYALGRFGSAQQEYRIALDRMSSVLGHSHVRTLRTRHALALTLRDLGDFAEAESEFRTVLDQYKVIHGEGHPQTLRTRYNIATVLHQRGHYRAAEGEYQSLLSEQYKRLGQDHPYTLRTHYSLGIVLRDLGRPDAALQQLRSVHAIQHRVLGERHHYTLRTLYAIATVVVSRDRVEARRLFESVLEEQTVVLGPDHSETRATRRALEEL